MGELINFPTLDEGRDKSNLPKLTSESQRWLSQINSDNLKSITKTISSMQKRVSSDTEKTVQQRLSGWSKQGLVDLINRASEAEMMKNPTYYYVAFGMLVEYEE